MAASASGSPRFVVGHGLVLRETGLDIVGGARLARIGTRQQPDVTLAMLLMLRDGVPAARVAEELGLPPEAVRDRMDSLATSGAVSFEAAPGDRYPTQMVRFFERTVGVGTARAALRRLEQATVLLATRVVPVSSLARLLVAAGVGTVMTDLAPGGVHPDLVVTDARDSPDDRPTLLISVEEGGIVVGPLCHISGGSCAACAEPLGESPVAAEGKQEPALAPSVGAATALTAAEVVRHLSGTGRCRTAGTALRVGDAGGQQRSTRVTRAASCRRCGPLVTSAPAAVETAYRQLQQDDVPLRQNWARPLRAVSQPQAHSTLQLPTLREPARGEGVARTVFDSLAATLCSVPAVGVRPVPSIAGASFLNVFALDALAGDGLARTSYLDRRAGRWVALPNVPAALVGDGQLVLVVSATLNRAENLFGARARITVQQDAGFLLARAVMTLRQTAGRADWRSDDLAIASALWQTLALDAERDVVVGIVRSRPLDEGLLTGQAPARRQSARDDRDGTSGIGLLLRALADSARSAVAPAPITYVYARHIDDLAPGLYLFTDGLLQTTDVSTGGLEHELAERALDPTAMVVLGHDLADELSLMATADQDSVGLAHLVVEQAAAGAHLVDVLERHAVPAVLAGDLDSVALAPDGRGWRTSFRSFVSVFIDSSTAAPATSVVEW